MTLQTTYTEYSKLISEAYAIHSDGDEQTKLEALMLIRSATKAQLQLAEGFSTLVGTSWHRDLNPGGQIR